MLKPDCPHSTSMDPTGRGSCSLNLYGGHPLIGNCLDCISRKQNNPAHAATLLARATLSHPTSATRISGCCDRADQS